MNRELTITKDQSLELINLGVDTTKSSCIWIQVKAITTDRSGLEWILLPEHIDKQDETHVPTFSLQDLLDILKTNNPALCYISEGWFIELWNPETNLLDYATTTYESPLQAAFECVKKFLNDQKNQVNNG